MAPTARRVHNWRLNWLPLLVVLGIVIFALISMTDYNSSLNTTPPTVSTSVGIGSLNATPPTASSSVGLSFQR